MYFKLKISTSLFRITVRIFDQSNFWLYSASTLYILLSELAKRVDALGNYALVSSASSNPIYLEDICIKLAEVKVKYYIDKMDHKEEYA